MKYKSELAMDNNKLLSVLEFAINKHLTGDAKIHFFTEEQ